MTEKERLPLSISKEKSSSVFNVVLSSVFKTLNILFAIRISCLVLFNKLGA